MGYSPPTMVAKLEFLQIADQSLAAGASITPTVDGLFSAVLSTDMLRVEIYSDYAGSWLNSSKDKNAVYVTIHRGWEAVVGQLNKIRFTNADGAAQNIVVNKIG